MKYIASPRLTLARAYPKGERGFTVIEMMITMGLLGIFLVVIATLFTASVDVQTRSRSYSAVTTDARYVMARLDYDVARASAVTSPASLGGGGNTLVLTIGSSSYTYTLSGGRLQLTDPTGTDYLTGTDETVSNLTFTKLGNTGGLESIQYTFTMTGTGLKPGSVDAQTYTSTAERRS